MSWPLPDTDRLAVVETTLTTLSHQMMQVIGQLERVRELLSMHMVTHVPEMLAEGREWGSRLEAGIGTLGERVAALENGH